MDKKRIRNWILKVITIFVVSVFVIGYFLPLLISGGSFSVLIGIGCAILFAIALVFESFELYAEVQEILENKK